MPFIVHITGAPGCGKGTQAALLKQEMGFECFSVGQLMRDEVASGSELGKKLEFINQGKIAPPELAMECIRKHVTNPSFKYVLLDGFPRTPEQLQFYNQMIGPADLTVIIDLDENNAFNRLKNRQLGGSERVDDTDQIIINRFRQYQDLTVPVMNILRNDKQQFVVQLDANQPIQIIHQLIKSSIKKRIANCSNK